MDILRILWGSLSRLSSAATRDGWVCFIPISQGVTLATARLEIKAHVLAVLEGFWDQMVFDLPMQNLMHRGHWEWMG